MSAERTAIIIGGGPAGLTTALELLERTDIKPIVYEGADNVGGIARTYLHAGNRIDIGGHRFFSKSTSFLSSVALVSSGSSGIARWAMMSPVSIPSSI